jgi:hypothetical protein
MKPCRFPYTYNRPLCSTVKKNWIRLELSLFTKD